MRDGASAWLCEASAAAPSSFSFPSSSVALLPEIPQPRGCFGVGAIPGRRGSPDPNAALPSPRGRSGAGARPAPFPRVPCGPGWGSSCRRAEAAELSRVLAIKSTRSRWSVPSVSPPPPPRSSSPHSLFPTPFILLFCRFILPTPPGLPSRAGPPPFSCTPNFCTVQRQSFSC